MKTKLLALAAGLLVLLATHTTAMAAAVASTYDVLVTNYDVAFPGGSLGEGPLDTVALNGQISFVARYVPPNPIQPQAYVKALAIPALTGLGDSTFREYQANGSSTPTTNAYPTDPLRLLFETRLISHFYPVDPITPNPPEAAQIYTLLVDATLQFDAAQALNSVTINSITVPPAGL